jgi:predicted small secreted protein
MENKLSFLAGLSLGAVAVLITVYLGVMEPIRANQERLAAIQQREGQQQRNIVSTMIKLHPELVQKEE